jgi:endogenous inhibitor of DNA gyrase (YacG/DUF329 family)
MTSPVEQVKVECPKCGRSYTTDYRASMNLGLDDFDEKYVREMSTGTCPSCGHEVELGALVVEPDGVWRWSK